MADGNFTQASLNVVPPNPLIGSDAEDTLANISSVLTYLGFVSTQVPETEPGESVRYGHFLILETCRRAVDSLLSREADKPVPASS